MNGRFGRIVERAAEVSGRARRRKFLFAWLAAASMLTAQGSRGADDPAACGYAPGSTVVVRRSIELPSRCELRGVQFVIAASDVTLDCHDAVLHGLLHRNLPNPVGEPYPERGTPRDMAFLISQREGQPPLRNITIKNCHVRNYLDGANVLLQLSEQTKRTLRATRNPVPLEDRLRRDAPQHITFEKVRIDFAHKSGLFLNRYVSHLVFRHGAVTNSGNAAVYLNSGAMRNEISDSLFAANGYYSYSDRDRVRSPKPETARREAIAIDSSSRNLIRGNQFSGNAAGAVFLYKNCWEHWRDPDQLPRNMHSSGNLIVENRFSDEKVGVWIASRRTRDLAGFDCGDPPVYKVWGWFGEKRYYRDYAEGTEVRANEFEDVAFGIRVEDDAAVLAGNRFSGAATANITIGSSIRGTVSYGNSFRDGAPR